MGKNFKEDFTLFDEEYWTEEAEFDFGRAVLWALVIMTAIIVLVDKFATPLIDSFLK